MDMQPVRGHGEDHIGQVNAHGSLLDADEQALVGQLHERFQVTKVLLVQGQAAGCALVFDALVFACCKHRSRERERREQEERARDNLTGLKS